MASTQNTLHRNDKIRSIVAVQDSSSRTTISNALSALPDIDLVGECSNCAEVRNFVKHERLDLIILDIDLAGKEHFSLPHVFEPTAIPIIIFVTPNDHSALNSFNTVGLNFLTKPVDALQLETALKRARLEVHRKRTNGEVESSSLSSQHRPSNESGVLERIAVRTNGSFTILKTEDIDWIEAWGDYVRIHVKGSKHVIRERISNLETRLDPGKFVRIHRSAIVQMDRIRELQPMFHGDCQVVLNDSTTLTLSRNYRNRLSHLLHNCV
jgi:two-component system LytT family response regulator